MTDTEKLKCKNVILESITKESQTLAKNSQERETKLLDMLEWAKKVIDTQKSTIESLQAENNFLKDMIKFYRNDGGER